MIQVHHRAVLSQDICAFCKPVAYDGVTMPCC